MRISWLKLLLFLVPALVGGLLLLLWLSPEKKILRRADAIFSTIERGTLSLSGIEERVERFNGLVEPTFEIAGPDPIPAGPITRAEAAGLLVEFHESVISCEVVRGEPSVAFPAKILARFECPIDVRVNVGGGSPRTRRFRCQMEFRRSEEGWLLTRIAFIPV